MSRYFLELAYKGTAYSGFQVQENAATIQSVVEDAFRVLHRETVRFTGSSRTDAGVHALQNFFHFDHEGAINPQFVYKMNAILPQDIVVKALFQMPDGAHSRFDAISREYIYRIHRSKDPFVQGLSHFYPYKLDLNLMQQAAAIVKKQSRFFAFCKTNTQVTNFNCTISVSQWMEKGEELVYNIEGNRFLRGMVRLLTASMLKVGRGQLPLEDFERLFYKEEKCGFSVPATGLFLKKVAYPQNYFPAPGLHLQSI